MSLKMVIEDTWLHAQSHLAYSEHGNRRIRFFFNLLFDMIPNKMILLRLLYRNNFFAHANTFMLICSNTIISGNRSKNNSEGRHTFFFVVVFCCCFLNSGKKYNLCILKGISSFKMHKILFFSRNPE